MGSAATRRMTVRFAADGAHEHGDSIAVEAPLTLVLDDEVLVTTMRTPGHDLELAAGWLVAESAVHAHGDIATMAALAARTDQDTDTVRIALAAGVEAPRPRAFMTSSACGVCSADIIAGVRLASAPLHSDEWTVGVAQVDALMTDLRSAQRTFERTGALHAAGLVDPSGTLLVTREDVGRHNAVDKVVGWALLGEHAPLTDHLMLVSGRVSYEIVQKCLAAGVAGVAAVSGPTSLAVDVAREYGLVLIGFAREGRCNVYSGADRVRA